jgi:hypothetical protein
MQKEDKILEIMAWLCIIAIIAFCIRFNYKMYHWWENTENIESVWGVENQLNDYGVKNVLKK